ncbi:MAG: carbohydrate-binding family 9-like protein [Myxococcota bacterium]
MRGAVACFASILLTVGGCSAKNDSPQPTEPQANSNEPSADRPASVESDRAPPPLPTLEVPKAKDPPRIDGALTDAAWRTAAQTGPFVNTLTGEPASLVASAKLLWDEDYLYVGVEAVDATLRSVHRDTDDPLWEEDCVELMVAPPGSGAGYFEIEVSPRGVVFDTRFDRPRAPAPYGHVGWTSDPRVAVRLAGTLDDFQADEGYTVEIAIPWRSFGTPDRPVAAPAIGDRWRANFFVLDRSGDEQNAAAWSAPLVGDFHVPARFGSLVFRDPTAKATTRRGPIPIPSERVRGTVSREQARDPGVRDALIKRRVMSRRHPGEPPPLVLEADRTTLETGEAAH